eukprot:1559104-Amphidinium_carterae.2
MFPLKSSRALAFHWIIDWRKGQAWVWCTCAPEHPRQQKAAILAHLSMFPESHASLRLQWSLSEHRAATIVGPT